MDADTKKLAGEISNLLKEGKYNEALAVTDESQYQVLIKNGSWELIPSIISLIHDNTILVTPALHNACEKLLHAVTEKGNLDEVLLELIEQVESAKNDAQFLVLLGPMQKVLVKEKNKRNRSLEWCFNAIVTYIENVPLPEHNLVGQERMLMDSDNSVRRVEKIYSSLPEFYSIFIEECNADDECKITLLIFLIGLLGKPILHLDVEREVAANSAARKCCEVIIADICKLQKDVLKYLVYVEYKFKENYKDKEQSMEHLELDDAYLHSEKLEITHFSGLLYIALSGEFDLPEYSLPQVYHPEYIVRNSLFAVQHLLSFTTYGCLNKGIILCKALFTRLSTPVSHELLISSIYFNILKNLVNVAVYCTYENIRKLAVTLIGFQINIFDYKGRCILIKSLLDMANHSGMIGYAITLYKNSLEEVFKLQREFPDCFTDLNLMIMLKKILFLPHGAESDLVELADQIITALNFIIYLSLKDASNKTGIRSFFSYIETEYFDKLRVGLNMSKAHYQLKLKDIEEGNEASHNKVDISINLGGTVLEDIPLENQKEVIHSALNAFHLMEGLLARAAECIDLNKARA